MSQIKGFGRAMYEGHRTLSLGHILNETPETVLFLEDGSRTPFWTRRRYIVRLPEMAEVGHV